MQVFAFQHRLGSLHGTDLVALKRAHATLSQHVLALQDETQVIEPLLRQVQEDILSAEFIADELAGVTLAGGTAYLLLKTVKLRIQPAVRIQHAEPNFVCGYVSVIIGVGKPTISWLVGWPCCLMSVAIASHGPKPCCNNNRAILHLQQCLAVVLPFGGYSRCVLQRPRRSRRVSVLIRNSCAVKKRSTPSADLQLLSIHYLFVPIVPQVQRWLHTGILGAAAAFVAWRFVSHLVSRQARVHVQRKKVKRKLATAWQLVSQRIEIMAALAQWAPRSDHRDRVASDVSSSISEA